MEVKPWYQSKSIWAGVATGIVGIYNAIALHNHWPPIPDWAFAILGSMGIYSRVVADTKIG